jgi:hypothetical protein
MSGIGHLDHGNMRANGVWSLNLCCRLRHHRPT